MVSKNHGYKWFAVMVFTLSRLEHGWFRRNSVCCSPVYGLWLSLRFGYGAVYDSRLSLRGGFGPVCIQHLSSRTATSPMPSTLGMIHRYVQTLLYFYIHRLPSSRLLCRLNILKALAASLLLRSNGGVVLLNLRQASLVQLQKHHLFHLKLTHACPQGSNQKRERRKVALGLAICRFDPVVKTGNEC